ncbi:MAG TPA: hypothetical protein VMW54_09625 [Terriglobia bacterium]|nr:hypothetical protein [Terriglobia bacterium]
MGGHLPFVLRGSGESLKAFPVTVQWSRLPNRPALTKNTAEFSTNELRAMIDDIIGHGFTGLEFPLHLPANATAEALKYAQSRGMYITYNRTFEKGGVENFVRNAPPTISVFSPEYAAAVRKNVVAAFDAVKGVPHPYNVFCYHDEPFHAGPESFDYGEDVKREFKKRFGYKLPPDVESARKDPRVWLDVINFRADEFPAGWRQAYKIIKEIDPTVRVILTHDSHSTFGGGVRSNSKIAVDDVFHWGADFADTFVFDIYPYMMFDFRYGECGKLRKPRLSQMHYAFGQMRNLTYTYGKELGFWFGTFNKKWFARFMGPDLKAKYWAEREITFTAVAQGANFLISGYNIPEDARHWGSLGEGLRVLQKAGPGLLKAPKKKAKACFLFPRTQYIQLQEEYWNVGLSYELFLRAFGELDILHEEQVRDSQLDGYQILTMFDVRLLPDEVARTVRAFVERGGVVIADCVPNLDAYKQPSAIMENLFGVRDAATRRIMRSGVWVPSLAKPHWFIPPEPGSEESAIALDHVKGTTFNRKYDFRIASPRPCKVGTGEVLLKTVSGHPAVIHRRVGNGQVFLLGFCVQDTYFQTWKDQDPESRNQLRDLLHRLTEAARVRAHVYSSNAEVEAAVRINSKEGYVFVMNHEAESAHTNVRLADLDFTVGEIVDLADEAAVKFNQTDDGLSFNLTVLQEKPRLLRLRPRKA